MVRIRLGELLVSMNVLSEAQLHTALAVQYRNRCRLGRALTAMKLVREEHLVQALAQQQQIQYVRLEGRTIPEAVLKRLPVKAMQRFQVIPVALRGERGPLVVAMADPQDLKVIDELRFASAMEIVPVLAGEQQIADALARHNICGPRVVDPLELPDEDVQFEITRGQFA